MRDGGRFFVVVIFRFPSKCVCVCLSLCCKKFNIQLSNPLPSPVKWSETFPCSLCVVTCVFCVVVWFPCSGGSITLHLCLNGSEKAVECCNHFTGAHWICPFVPARTERAVCWMCSADRETVSHSGGRLNGFSTTVPLSPLSSVCFLCARGCVVWPRSLSCDNLFQARLWCDKMTGRNVERLGQQCGLLSQKLQPVWVISESSRKKTTLE